MLTAATATSTKPTIRGANVNVLLLLLSLASGRHNANLDHHAHTKVRADQCIALVGVNEQSHVYGYR
jgi:hypothetical protein